jgi:hypothetical protein
MHCSSHAIVTSSCNKDLGKGIKEDVEGFICRRKERKKEKCEDSVAIYQTSSTIKERRKAQGFPSSARTTRGTTQWDVKEGNQGKIQELRESSTMYSVQWHKVSSFTR